MTIRGPAPLRFERRHATAQSFYCVKGVRKGRIPTSNTGSLDGSPMRDNKLPRLSYLRSRADRAVEPLSGAATHSIEQRFRRKSFRSKKSQFRRKSARDKVGLLMSGRRKSERVSRCAPACGAESFTYSLNSMRCFCHNAIRQYFEERRATTNLRLVTRMRPSRRYKIPIFHRCLEGGLISCTEAS